MNSSSRYWYDWKPDDAPRYGRIAEYSDGVIVASTFHACTSCSSTRDTRASILNAGGSASSRIDASAARSS
ncbi:Uncharacterised protein [Burkholderia pseudomallei]|nr:Uncharacterised protein [Burkholderia pseudomallei]